MDLKERKKKILEVIIKDYINNAEPVGSRTLSRRYALGISPATIRNEMADLEEMGYLIQPHTSSGRIPTQKAYRYYVDEIMQIQKLAETMQRDIHRGYLKVMNELAHTMDHTARILSEITNYPSVILSPKVSCLSCKHVQIVPLIKERVMLILVTQEGIAKNIEMSLSREIDIALALKLSNVLNSLLGHLSFKKMGNELIENLKDLTPTEKELLSEVMTVLRDVLLKDVAEVHATGLTNLFNYPEFSDVEKIRHIIKVIEEKPLLASAITEHGTPGVLHISIGDENNNEDLKEFSIITATYELEGNTIGAFGVIGPTRMDYDRVSSVLEYLRNELNTNLIKLLK